MTGHVTFFDSQAKFVNEDGVLTDLAFIFLGDLWLRTGGHKDIIGDIVIGGAVQVVVVGLNYTTTGNQRVICTQALTVNLNANPQNGEIVDVKRTNGEVVVFGSGRNVDNDDRVTLTIDFAGVQLYFSASINTWIIT